MRLPRLTTWRLMAVVAVAAMASSAWRAERLKARTLDYQLRALDHAVGEAIHAERRADAAEYFNCSGIGSCPNPKLAAYHAAMSSKYEHAARYPWLPVPPDPPPPK